VPNSHSSGDLATVIVGAGICGLTVALGLAGPVTILEKSRGVGGRIATRRTANGKFDHGAQFYSLKPAIEPLHRRWVEARLTKLWLEHQGSQRFASATGMTSLAKNLATDLDIRLEKKVLKLRREGNQWQVEIENSEPMTAKNVILTCPLPQSIELLKASGISFDPRLAKVTFAKALVGLYEDVQGVVPSSGYTETPTETIFSISDQSRKGLSEKSAWTVVMDPKFSDKNFDSSDSDILSKITLELKKLEPSFKCGAAQLKKWRYSHPLETYSSSFAQPQAGLFLAGDAFGGPSLNGAVASATALLKELSNERF